MSVSSAVTLVDGDCALCSGYARFVSAFDRAGRVYFETQQSPAGRALLRKAKMPEDLSTIALVERDERGNLRGFVKSTAVLRTFEILGWPLALLAGLRGPVDRRKYALGAAAACLTMTLPAQLALGYVLGPSRRGIVALHVAVAWAQLCRQGPLWAAIAVAVKDEVGARRRRL